MKHENRHRKLGKLNVLNPGSSQVNRRIGKYRQTLPNMNELIRVKGQIQTLSSEELHLAGVIRNEFRRQLFEIRNLYRIVSSAVLSSRAPTTQTFADDQSLLLLDKWNKMKSLIIVAGFYCV